MHINLEVQATEKVVEVRIVSTRREWMLIKNYWRTGRTRTHSR
jgi:hypothetical protein